MVEGQQKKLPFFVMNEINWIKNPVYLYSNFKTYLALEMKDLSHFPMPEYLYLK